MYEFHRQAYEHYQGLLDRAQRAGDERSARSAAHMLLLHLREMFQSLPEVCQQQVRAGMMLYDALGFGQNPGFPSADCTTSA